MKAPGAGGYISSHGAVIRGDTTQKRIALVFSGHEFAEGGAFIAQTLEQAHVKASFFFTGDFYSNPAFQPLIRQLKKAGHYLGPHSDKHLLYCDWTKRDSLLVTKQQFRDDILHCYAVMNTFGIQRDSAPYFLPPYEWYNDTIAAWTNELGLQLINFTPGTLSNADYTTPDLKNYRDSKTIFRSIINFNHEQTAGLNGFILLLHIGTDPVRTDKFYLRLPQLVQELKAKGYAFQTVSQLLHPQQVDQQ